MREKRRVLDRSPNRVCLSYFGCQPECSNVIPINGYVYAAHNSDRVVRTSLTGLGVSSTSAVAKVISLPVSASRTLIN